MSSITLPEKPVEYVKFKPLKSEAGTPVLPSKKNFITPSRQGQLEKEIFGKLKKDLTAAFNKMIAELNKLPKVAINASSKEYKFLVDRQGISSIIDKFDNILNKGLLGDERGEYVKGLSWSDVAIDRAYMSGTRDAIESAKRVTPSSKVGNELSRKTRNLSLDSDETVAKVARRAAITQARVFEDMKKITKEGRKSLANSLTIGILGGMGVTDISKIIQGVVESSLKRATVIARTEINSAYRNASASETESINREVFDGSEWEMRLMWFSALTSTTRDDHASSNGQVYTKEQVDSFYSVNGNAINCYCNQVPVLWNRRTGEILQGDLQQQMMQRSKEWEEAKKKEEKERKEAAAKAA